MRSRTDRAIVGNGVDGVLADIPEAVEGDMGTEEEEEEVEGVIMEHFLQRIPRTLLLRLLDMRR